MDDPELESGETAELGVRNKRKKAGRAVGKDEDSDRKSMRVMMKRNREAGRGRSQGFGGGEGVVLWWNASEEERHERDLMDRLKHLGGGEFCETLWHWVVSESPVSELSGLGTLGIVDGHF